MRAVDHEGEVLESYVTKTRDKAAALSFIKRAMKQHGHPQTVVADGLRSYGAAMKDIGNIGRQEIGCWLNNRAENSHQSFRRRERAMERFRRMNTLDHVRWKSVTLERDRNYAFAFPLATAVGATGEKLDCQYPRT